VDSQVEIRVKAKFSSRVARARLARLARKTLRAERARATVTIYVTDDAEIRRLNRAYHATDAPTDVLAFPTRATRGKGQRASREHHAAPLAPYDELGDVIISYDRARVQARQVGWRIADEVDLLAVHGILHLLGYDDRTAHQRARMWQRQADILGKPIPQ